MELFLDVFCEFSTVNAFGFEGGVLILRLHVCAGVRPRGFLHVTI